MIRKISELPSVEPVSSTEVKEFLRVDSQLFEDDILSVQSVAPGLHVAAADYGLEGTGVDVLGKNSLIEFAAGTNGSGGTVDVKVQESDDNATFTDVTDGAFTQVTEANDNATFEKGYGGSKQYIRVVVTVAGASCSFGVNVITDEPTSAEDDTINDLIKTARRHAEKMTDRAFITQTWNFFWDFFPPEDFIVVPKGQLQDVTSLIYRDIDNDQNIVSNATYIVDTDSDPGRIVLAHGQSWPTVTLGPSNPVEVVAVCGYGDAAGDVPEELRTWIKQCVAWMFLHRESEIEEFPVGVLTQFKIWSF